MVKLVQRLPTNINIERGGYSSYLITFDNVIFENTNNSVTDNPIL